MDKVVFERGKLLKMVEVLRNEPSLDAETMIGMIEIEQNDFMPASREGYEKIKLTKKGYTESQKNEFLRVIKEHKEPMFVPSELVRQLAEKNLRTESAIMAQLYDAYRTIKGE